MSGLVDAPKLRRGPYAKTAATRQRLVDAAIELFGTTGFLGSTMTDIAAHAGMTLTGALHHFPTKEALLTAVLQERERRSAHISAPESALEGMEAIVRIVEDNIRRPELIQLHCVLSAEATFPDHPAHDYFRRRYAKVRVELTDSFAALAESGSLQPGLSPARLAVTLLALMDGLQVQWLLDRSSVDMHDEVHAFLQFVIPDLK